MFHRKKKKDFLFQINKIINWDKIELILNEHYEIGKKIEGRRGYPSIVLFKMLLLQYWYGLSDYELEEQCNDLISFTNFIGVPLELHVPDHSRVSRFRTILAKQGTFDLLLNELNEQLEKNNLIVKKGVIVDASVTDTNRKPRGKKKFEIIEAGSEDNGVEKNEPVVKTASNVDREGAWLKKGNKIHYGYKKHVSCDEEGLILAVHTTPANESDIKNLEIVIEKSNLKPQTTVAADKGYYSEDNKNIFKKRKLKSRIMHKATKGKPLSKRSLSFNKKISETRFKIERCFGSMKIWSGAGKGM